jgi:hypothetical protein
VFDIVILVMDHKSVADFTMYIITCSLVSVGYYDVGLEEEL